jgi:type IV pilus assembly protein PilW
MSPRPRSSPPRGFTLVEVILASVISAVVVAGGVALLLSQQRMYQSSSGERGMQETARIALTEMEENLRRAGYGVDPPLVFDFGFADAITMSQAPKNTGKLVRVSPAYKCVDPVACRDKTDLADGSDELVFYSRDPNFGHTLTSVTSATQISINGPLQIALEEGQVLQLICMTDPMYWAYVTVGAHVATTTTAAPVVVPLSGGVGGNLLDFPYQQGVLADATASVCFKSGVAAAMVTKVDRYRYYVSTFDDAGNAVAPESKGSHTCLMRDQGLTYADGTSDATCVAPDVEDLQLGYQLPNGAVWLVGFDPGTPIEAGPNGIDLASTGPGFGTRLSDASRITQHPANIRAVKISVVVRTPVQDITVTDAEIPAAGNRKAVDGLPGYRRMRVDTTVTIPNMDSRAPYFPNLSTNNGTDLLNVGGG